MPATLRHHAFTLDDYFAIERERPDKHEFFDRQVFLMAGGSARHNALSANVVVALAGALRASPGSGCRVLSADQRISTPEGLYTYADATVVCGAPELGREQTLANPTILVEVLSDATRDYDRGDKLARYQAIPSLRHVLLVEQARVDVECWSRTTEGWSRRVVTTLEAVLALDPPGIRIAVASLYEGALEL